MAEQAHTQALVLDPVDRLSCDGAYLILFCSICFSVPEFINLETSKIVFENNFKPRRKSLVSARSEGDSPRNGHVTFLPPLISTSGVGSDLETETHITNGKSRKYTYKVTWPQCHKKISCSNHLSVKLNCSSI